MDNLSKEKLFFRDAGEDDVVDDLRVSFGEAVQVKEEHSAAYSTDHDECNIKSGDTVEESPTSIGSGPATSEKQLSKSATFPDTNLASPASMNGDGDDATSGSSLESGYFPRSGSLRTTRKLISALKGSREREGLGPKMLSVSWAPDVYDPPPTSLSHVPKKKNQQQYKSTKKYGKGKQKGKSVRGSGGAPKDKKHYRKTGGGRSDRRMDTYSNTDRVMPSNYKSNTDILDFDDEEGVDGPDSNCGSSFLRKARGAVRVAYAEAS